MASAQNMAEYDCRNLGGEAVEYLLPVRKSYLLLATGGISGGL